MELVKWRYRNPYHDRRHERERMFVIGSHTVILDQQPSEDISLHQNTGFLIWDGSYLMAKFIAERVRVTDKSCLELGAGSALVSIVAHLQGASRVVATDLSEYLQFMRRNIERNVPSQSIEIRELTCTKRSSLLYKQ
ncbi:Methyltransferase-like protein 21B [Coemansia sp. RSA 455]|nr:Methyltransferase-like protein 21B [Coemansia sp. RSA 455]